MAYDAAAAAAVKIHSELPNVKTDRICWCWQEQSEFPLRAGRGRLNDGNSLLGQASEIQKFCILDTAEDHD